MQVEIFKQCNIIRLSNYFREGKIYKRLVFLLFCSKRIYFYFIRGLEGLYNGVLRRNLVVNVLEALTWLLGFFDIACPTMAEFLTKAGSVGRASIHGWAIVGLSAMTPSSHSDDITHPLAITKASKIAAGNAAWADARRATKVVLALVTSPLTDQAATLILSTRGSNIHRWIEKSNLNLSQLVMNNSDSSKSGRYGVGHVGYNLYHQIVLQHLFLFQLVVFNRFCHRNKSVIF